MVWIILTKEGTWGKKGEKLEVTNDEMRLAIAEGFAKKYDSKKEEEKEVVEEATKPEEDELAFLKEYNNIYISRSELEALRDKYPGAWSETLTTIKNKGDYYEEHTFNEHFRDFQLDKIKDSFRIESLNKIEGEDELIKLLKNKDLFKEITEKELDKKIVGEILSRKVIFLCACGRLVENAQIASYNLLVNDVAGTGKDYVTEKTLQIIPEENYVKRTRISQTVFTYWHNPKFEPEWTWNGKVFYNEDISENVLNSEVFKVMCSSGSHATVVIRQRAIDLEIAGKPVMIVTAATANPNPELTRRFEILNLDESIDQTRAIMKRHAEYARKGITPEYDEKYTNAMKLLNQVRVKIPYANILDQYFPSQNLMMRTKFPRFLDMIKASAAFHQYQRRKDNKGYLIANGQDYEVAVEIMVKLSSNKYMVSLTRNQKEILRFFEQNTLKNDDFCENLAKIHELLNHFLSLPALKDNLDKLVSYGILRGILDKDQLNRDIEKFKLAQEFRGTGAEVLKFPAFKDLIKVDTKDSKDIKVNKDSKDIKENLQ